MQQLNLPTRRAMRLACRAARDAVDACCTALSRVRQGTGAVAELGRLAPRLRSLACVDLRCRRSDFAAIGAALAALPNPGLLTRLDLSTLDFDALGLDRDGAWRLEAALSNLTGLRRLALHWLMDAKEMKLRESMSERVAAALSMLRPLPELADLELCLDVHLSHNADKLPLYTAPPASAELLPWHQLERVALLRDAAALLPLLTQPEVAPQLSRLRALRILFQDELHTDIAAASLVALFQAPWLSQLTSLRLEGLTLGDDNCRKVFEALPAPDEPRTLLPAIQELHFCADWCVFVDNTPDAQRRLLAVCSLGALRELVLAGFRGVRSGLAERVDELTALTSLDLGRYDTWRYVAEKGDGGGAPAAVAAERAEQLAMFLTPPTITPPHPLSNHTHPPEYDNYPAWGFESE